MGLLRWRVSSSDLLPAPLPVRKAGVLQKRGLAGLLGMQWRPHLAPNDSIFLGLALAFSDCPDEAVELSGERQARFLGHCACRADSARAADSDGFRETQHLGGLSMVCRRHFPDAPSVGCSKVEDKAQVLAPQTRTVGPGGHTLSNAVTATASLFEIF